MLVRTYLRPQVRVVSVTDVVDQGKQSQVLRARDITRSLEPCLFIPGVLQSYKDSTVLAEVRQSLMLLSTTCCPQDKQTTHKKASHCIVSLQLLRDRPGLNPALPCGGCRVFDTRVST